MKTETEDERVRISHTLISLSALGICVRQVRAGHKFISAIGLISRWIEKAGFRIFLSELKKNGALHAGRKRETDAAALLHIGAASLSCLISQPQAPILNEVFLVRHS